MKADDIRAVIERKISDWITIFCLSVDEMYVVAKNFRWNNEKMQTEWFEKQDKLKISLGLFPDPKMAKDPKINASLVSVNKARICLCCYELLEKNNTFALQCGHTFCTSCWEEHAKAFVMGDNYQTNPKCMQQGCNIVFGHS